MRQAACLRHAQREAGLTAAELVAHEAAAPISKEVSGVSARPALGQVVNHGPQVFEGHRCIGPQVGAVRLALARLEHGDRCLVGVQYAVREHCRIKRVDQRLQLNAAGAN